MRRFHQPQEREREREIADRPREREREGERGGERERERSERQFVHLKFDPTCHARVITKKNQNKESHFYSEPKQTLCLP